jgi:Predicted membrane protein
MSTKTAKVLQVIAFILILLSTAFVVVGWLVFKDELMALVNAPAEYAQAEFTPWLLFIETGFMLLLALIWLLVLLSKPGRGTTIAMTVILSILLIGYFAVGKPFLNVWLQQKAAEAGVYNLAALSTYHYGASTLANFALIPGVFLMVLSLGSACGKNFKTQTQETEEQSVQESYGQRPVEQPNVQRPQYGQPNGQRPQFGQPGPQMQQYGQGYGQKPQMQNTGYAPRTETMQNTGYLPKVDVPQNTGYIPKVDVPQETGTLPPIDSLAHKTGAIPPVEFSKPTQTPSSPILYPWMKAYGAPKEEAAESQGTAEVTEALEDAVEDVIPDDLPTVEVPEDLPAEKLPEESKELGF